MSVGQSGRDLLPEQTSLAYFPKKTQTQNLLNQSSNSLAGAIRGVTMRDLARRLALITPAFAIAAGGASGAGASSSDTRALALNVIESGDRVEVELIANSPVTQQVEYEIELTGSSHARHRGSTSIAAGNRQVLSTLKTDVGDG
ncbi:hypothetical protein [Erythrobacter sp. Dej080120_24]|uniref:hypothetical protein n=1 Tax=Erythrobacter sp. Dej080120_24 TaxID=3024837 RepID=UPI0030C6B62D